MKFDNDVTSALAAADIANKENLLGMYPMAARVLAGEFLCLADHIEGVKIDMERIDVKNMHLGAENARLRAAIAESLRMAGNWPEGAKAVLEDALGVKP